MPLPDQLPLASGARLMQLPAPEDGLAAGHCDGEPGILGILVDGGILRGVGGIVRLVDSKEFFRGEPWWLESSESLKADLPESIYLIHCFGH